MKRLKWTKYGALVGAIIAIQPWKGMEVNSTISEGGANHVSSQIVITANRIFIHDIEGLKEELIEMYDTNTLPKVMLAEENFEKDATITFIVYANRVTRALSMEPLKVEYEKTE